MLKKANIITIAFMLLISLFLVTSCNEDTAEVPYQYTAGDSAQIDNNTLLLPDEVADNAIATQYYEQFATPILLQILLNGEATALAGYVIYGQTYFRIDDIAYMLRDTQARFNFDTWSLFRWGGPVSISRFRHYDRDARLDSEGEFYRTYVGISESVPVSSGGTTPRDILAPIETFITETHTYFTLEALSGFLGFTIDYTPDGIVSGAISGAISINTHEIELSEYGRRVAEEFLSRRPSLFPRPYQNHDRDALSFLLYDINGNGIPDIFIQYAEQPDVYAVYVYFAEDSEYLFIGTVNLWHEVMRDAEGRFYVVCGSSSGDFLQDRFTDVRMLILHELNDAGQWSSVLGPSAFITNRTGLTFVTDMNKPATAVRPLQWELVQIISEAVTKRLAVPAQSTPIIARILLNNKAEPISLAGHTIEGRNYFNLSAIAYMLQDTRAHFDFTEWRMNLHNTNIRVNRRDGLHTNAATVSLTDLYPVRVQLSADMTLGSTHGDVWFSELSAFGTADNIYLALEDLGGILGFFLDYTADGGTIIIDTNEAYFSEYGLRVAKEFLMQRPAVFRPYPWSEEFLELDRPRRMSDVMGVDEWGEWAGYNGYDYPSGFRLHDLRGNGIPDIFISYWFFDWPTVFVLYSYFDGEYRRMGTVRQYGEIFRDRQGRIFFLEGTHQMWYDTMRMLTFDDYGANWDVMELIDWYGATLTENLDERSRSFWEHWTHPTPVMPDNLDEPLTSNRFLWDLTSYVREYVLSLWRE